MNYKTTLWTRMKMQYETDELWTYFLKESKACKNVLFALLMAKINLLTQNLKRHYFISTSLDVKFQCKTLN